jgi:hypothetical protein
LSITATKFAGSIDGAYLPWTGARSEAGVTAVLVDDEPPPPDDPQPAAIAARTAAAAIDRAFMRNLLVRPLGLGMKRWRTHMKGP